MTKKTKKRGRPAGDNPANTRLPEVRISELQLKAYKAAAKGADKSFSAWVRDVLDKGAK